VLQIYTIQIACRNDTPDIMTIKLIPVTFIDVFDCWVTFGGSLKVGID
jgi:hypothetical protein